MKSKSNANNHKVARKSNKSAKVIRITKAIKAKVPTKKALKVKQEKVIRQAAKAEAKSQLVADRAQAKLEREMLREQAKENRLQKIADKKAERLALAWKRHFDKCSFTFRAVGKNYKRLKAYKGFQFWFHGLLPTETDKLGALMYFASHYMKWCGFKVQLAIVDGYLVLGTKTKQPVGAIRKILATAVYAFLTGTGFYPVE